VPAQIDLINYVKIFLSNKFSTLNQLESKNKLRKAEKNCSLLNINLKKLEKSFKLKI